ncbi:MAG: hypothetical protein Q8K88_08155, partial [Bradyrhizobium sp.]|nr:hypothetical protein [Bradyrhizobium sp.]
RGDRRLGYRCQGFQRDRRQDGVLDRETRAGDHAAAPVIAGALEPPPYRHNSISWLRLAASKQRRAERVENGIILHFFSFEVWETGCPLLHSIHL